jgi:hypothetical protein
MVHLPVTKWLRNRLSSWLLRRRILLQCCFALILNYHPIPSRDSISRQLQPIAPISSMAGGDVAMRPRSQASNIFIKYLCCCWNWSITLIWLAHKNNVKFLQSSRYFCTFWLEANKCFNLGISLNLKQGYGSAQIFLMAHLCM